jgi:hypothetical protein
VHTQSAASRPEEEEEAASYSPELEELSRLRPPTESPEHSLPTEELELVRRRDDHWPPLVCLPMALGEDIDTASPSPAAPPDADKGIAEQDWQVHTQSAASRPEEEDEYSLELDELVRRRDDHWPPLVCLPRAFGEPSSLSSELPSPTLTGDTTMDRGPWDGDTGLVGTCGGCCCCCCCVQHHFCSSRRHRSKLNIRCMSDEY